MRRKHGLDRFWYEDGQKWIEVTWKDGELDGLDKWTKVYRTNMEKWKSRRFGDSVGSGNDREFYVHAKKLNKN
uniref:Uncharacterized protein n=1 Tax=viral metagenome TaxID=1070528 RepID=A0A6C0IUY2_9ZZZZ